MLITIKTRNIILKNSWTSENQCISEWGGKNGMGKKEKLLMNVIFRTTPKYLVLFRLLRKSLNGHKESECSNLLYFGSPTFVLLMLANGII